MHLMISRNSEKYVFNLPQQNWTRIENFHDFESFQFQSGPLLYRSPDFSRSYARKSRSLQTDHKCTLEVSGVFLRRATI